MRCARDTHNHAKTERFLVQRERVKTRNETRVSFSRLSYAFRKFAEYARARALPRIDAAFLYRVIFLFDLGFG